MLVGCMLLVAILTARFMELAGCMSRVNVEVVVAVVLLLLAPTEEGTKVESVIEAVYVVKRGGSTPQLGGGSWRIMTASEPYTLRNLSFSVSMDVLV